MRPRTPLNSYSTEHLYTIYRENIEVLVLCREMSTCTYLTCKVAGDSSADGGARTVRLLEAAAPLPRVDRTVRVQVAGVDEGLDAALVLVVLQVVHLLQRQLPVVVQVQVTKHPLGLRLAGGREVSLRLLAVLAPLLAVGHDHGEPV